MKRFEVTLTIEVEAENAETAFAQVRTNYKIQNAGGKFLDFVVYEFPYELAEDETVCD
jgi:hypothetical protein